MKAYISVAPQILALTKAGLPRKKPFRVNGELSIAELQAELKKKSDKKTVVEVKVTVPEMYDHFYEIATALKELSNAPKELEGVALEQTIEV